MHASLTIASLVTKSPGVNIYRTRFLECGDKLLVFDFWSHIINVIRMWYIVAYLYYLG